MKSERSACIQEENEREIKKRKRFFSRICKEEFLLRTDDERRAEGISPKKIFLVIHSCLLLFLAFSIPRVKHFKTIRALIIWRESMYCVICKEFVRRRKTSSSFVNEALFYYMPESKYTQKEIVWDQKSLHHAHQMHSPRSHTWKRIFWILFLFLYLKNKKHFFN